MKVSELLSSEEKWCRYVLAVDAAGRSVNPEDDRAVQFCLRGAIHHCYPEDSGGEYCRGVRRVKATPTYKRLAERLSEQGQSINFLGDINDTPTVSFEDIRAMIEEAGL